jgi:hypothetical protein
MYINEYQDQRVLQTGKERVWKLSGMSFCRERAQHMHNAVCVCVCVCVCGVFVHLVSLVSAASHSQKGSHRDRREMVVYEEGLFD